MSRKALMVLLFAAVSLFLAGCATHVHRDAPSWHSYKKAHPNARFVVVHNRPAPNRTCWKLARGWRCVVR